MAGGWDAGAEWACLKGAPATPVQLIPEYPTLPLASSAGVFRAWGRAPQWLVNGPRN